MALENFNSKEMGVLMTEYEESYNKDPEAFMKKISSSKPENMLVKC